MLGCKQEDLWAWLAKFFFEVQCFPVICEEVHEAEKDVILPVSLSHVQPLYNSDESFSKCLQDGCVNENAIDRVDVLALVAEKTGNKTIRYWAGANFNLVLIMARTHFNHPLMYLRATEPEYCLSWWLEHLDCDQHSKRIYDTNYSRLTPHDRNKFSAYDWFTNSENLKW